jgi:hypothetical protein
MIRGKYFTSATMAYRGGVRIGFGSNTWRNEVDDQSDDAATTPPTFPTEHPRVEDTWKRSYTGITLSGGLEVRKGKTRLQGYYGAELWVSFGGNKNTFTYGNALNTNTDASSVDGAVGTDYATDWTASGINNGTTDEYGNAARYTEIKVSTMAVGLRGFIGVEYFIPRC